MDRWDVAVVHAFKGARFDDGAIDVMVLDSLDAYRELVVEVAKHVWRGENAGKQRLPKAFEDGFQLRLSRLERGSAIATLEHVVPVGAQLSFEADVFTKAMRLIEGVVRAAAESKVLPSGFPRSALSRFRRWGLSLRDEESIELRGESGETVATYDVKVRAALLARIDTSYQAPADELGFVLAAHVRASRFELYRDRYSGVGVDVPLRGQDEELVLGALQTHEETRLRVVGEGAYSADGTLVRFVSVDRVEPADRQVDNTALWDAIDQMTAAISAEEWATIPCDGAENHDRYI